MRFWTRRLSLRARLWLFSTAILLLFASNVATHLWGSYARNESLLAFRETVEAAQLAADLGLAFENRRQQILVLDALRDTTDEALSAIDLQSALTDLGVIGQQLGRLGAISSEGAETNYRRFHQSASQLLSLWRDFYQRYNQNGHLSVEASNAYSMTLQHLRELDERQAFLAVQRSEAIDGTIALTDRITVIGFVSSILITLALLVGLLSSTNASLKRLKRGAQRFGSGDLTYRINEAIEAGEIKELAHSFNDMSEKLQIAIDEVQAAKTDADAANAAKSLFLANVSHELRTPLNAIIGYSEMLLDELSDDENIDRDQFGHDLSTIIFSGRQLLTLINDILDLAKIETGKMQLALDQVNPTEVIVQVCDALSPLVSQRNNHLTLSIDRESMREIYTDTAKLQQIITNLFSNACKFTENGHIEVTAQMTPNKLVISVTDDGIGMSEEQQAGVFEAFVQAEANTASLYGGTGLGLAIVRDFCQLLGGSVSVESKLEQGTQFIVSLPTNLKPDLEGA